MGILDEAIREHLELKRQHGADDSELKQLEDAAFGPPQRPDVELEVPDAASEAATQFMAQPDVGDGEDEKAEQPAEQSPVRREPVADVQEAPERVEEEAEEEDEVEAEEVEEEPAEEEQPAGEHQAVSTPPASHTTEERHAIADQPTEMFDVEEELAASEAAEPSEDELVAEEITEPRLGPAEPIADLDADDEAPALLSEDAAVEADEEEEDDFFDEQRLSDELDQALEAPLEPESEEMEYEAEADEAEADLEEQPAEEEAEADSEEMEQPVVRDDDEDVLEDTPDFLEEAPEDDQLWFEQKPPKDFDFDD